MRNTTNAFSLAAGALLLAVVAVLRASDTVSTGQLNSMANNESHRDSAGNRSRR